MFHAIGKPRVHGSAAEMEVRFARMAHRPAAYLVRKIENACLVGDLGARLGRNQPAREVQEGSAAADRLGPGARSPPDRPKRSWACRVICWAVPARESMDPAHARRGRAPDASGLANSWSRPAVRQFSALPSWPQVWELVQLSWLRSSSFRRLSPGTDALSGQACAPCQSRHCGSPRQVPRRSGWRWSHPPTSSAMWRCVRQSSSSVNLTFKFCCARCPAWTLPVASAALTPRLDGRPDPNSSKHGCLFRGRQSRCRTQISSARSADHNRHKPRGLVEPLY